MSKDKIENMREHLSDPKVRGKELKKCQDSLDERSLGKDCIKLYLKLAEDKLRNTEEQLQLFQAYFEYAPDAYYLSSLKGKIINGNKAAENLLGFQRKELIGKNLLKINLLSKKDIPRASTLLAKNIRGKRTGPDEFILRKKDGFNVPVEISTFPLKMKGKILVLGIARDITSRKKAEDALKESEKLYRALFERANDAVFLLNMDRTINAANKKAADMLGYTQEELVGKPTIEVISPSQHDKSLEKFENLVEGKSYPLYERIFRRKDGTEFPGEINVAIIFSEDQKPLYIQSIVRDITIRKQTEKQLKDSVKEKELLLKETHHRVKNNMQVMSSLLRLQSHSVQDSETKELFNKSQNMINSMALVHEKLYRTKSLRQVDFAEYISAFAPTLFTSYGVDPSRISLHLELENILVDINTAVPCSLIINELISNSLKYAFPDKQKGRITIILQHSVNGNSLLTIKDNGIGLPAALDTQNTETLGMRLVHDLVGQIGGEIEIKNTKGTEFRIEIPKKTPQDNK